MARTLSVLGLLSTLSAAYAFMAFAAPALPFGPFLAASAGVAGLIAGADWLADERPRSILRRRRRLGLCAHCGYALYGNVSRVCPECGGPAGQLRHPMKLGAARTRRHA